MAIEKEQPLVMSEDIPRVFISYSWSSEEHQQWVLRLATALRESGVDPAFDKWDLEPGQDPLAFMERMVNDDNIRKVLIVCDRVYAEKANSRTGGVGTETQIISSEIYTKHDQTKFVAVIAEKDEDDKPYLPTYYKSRIYIDLSDDDLYATEFEKLLRCIYDKPLHVKPELGKKPSFLTETDHVSLGTTSKWKTAMDAIKNGKPNADGALTDYFETFAENLEKFRIPSGEGEFDEKVVDSIDEFLPYRNEAIGIFLAVSNYHYPSEAPQRLHAFLESLIPYLSQPRTARSQIGWDCDNFRFIIHELFLYAVAALLKYERFKSVSHLVTTPYYLEEDDGFAEDATLSFFGLLRQTESLDHRNKRLRLAKLSLRADLIKQRAHASGLRFGEIMQADFVLHIRAWLDFTTNDTVPRWWPYTLVYKATTWQNRIPFRIFASARSREYFDRMKCIFDIETKEDLLPLFDAFKKHQLLIPRWGAQSLDYRGLLGFDELATSP